ncbi:Aspartyl protease family protein [Thalictrum thalictroides]|uniref:Aspartyl protease family protein n=1 Tax=Thalictrum thalictroides TaxID=46969 RepID=A0A7J6V9E0_THATH|nr:Aspartyl protease family protein [Thalictrum thalictroides]
MSPCSPLSNKDNTNSLNYTQFLIQDQSRVHSIHSRISKKKSFIGSQQAKIPANSGRSLGTGNFYVTVGFGTPKSDLPVIFDTGSDLTWIQCQPCAGGCYPQRDPIFDPSKSSTFSNISCNSPSCNQLSSGTGRSPRCSVSACVYSIQYGDQSYSVGIFGTETLTVTPSDVFPKFEFGCGQNNDGLFGQVAGLIGLGRDKVSFVSQTAQKYNKLFSYCIPSTSSGFLAFGVTSSVAKFTPLVTDSRGPSFYFLTLQGISVGATNLAISPSVFSVGGTIIDSGTVITRLPPSAYSALRTAFRNAMSSYPSAPALSILDTCYDFSGTKTVTVPKITLHFAGGTDLNVAQSGLLFATKTSQVCLAFAGNTDAGDVAIIGNKQQQTLEVIYDVAGGKLGFGPGGCS